MTGKKVIKHRVKCHPKKTASAKRVLTGLGSPKPSRRARQVRAGRNKPMPTTSIDPMESDSEQSEISIRMERLTSQRKDRLTRATPDERSLGESESEVGSIMSNLSVARKVPDRRKKQEEKENNVVRIQAVARGYIQRFLYRSLLAMENTKKQYFVITIQAHVRGHLQRIKGPRIKQKYTVPLRETISTQTSSRAKNVTAPPRNQQTKKKQRKDYPLRQGKVATLSRKRESTRNKNNRKPTRYRSDSDHEDNRLLPRELTIRKPRRHHSDSEESGIPVKQLTIRKPRRQHSDSEESSNIMPPRHVAARAGNTGRNSDRHRINGQQSPPRKIMMRVKRSRNQDGDMDRSEFSVEPEKPENVVSRRDRLMSLGGASERFGESESDVGSLMSGLSQARKVPDRRRLPGMRSTRGKKGSAKTNSAIKIQAVARAYIQRFAFKSRLLVEQSKKKFFAIQIQAVARGFLARRKLLK